MGKWHYLLAGLECIDACSCTDRKNEMEGEGTIFFVMCTLKQKILTYVEPISIKLMIFWHFHLVYERLNVSFLVEITKSWPFS